MAAIGAWVRVVLPQVVGSTLPEGPSSPAKPAPAVQAVTAMAPAGVSMALTYLGDLLSGTAAQAAQQVPTGWLACVDQPADHGPWMHTHNPAACVAQDLLSGAAHSRFPVAAVLHLLITLYTPAAYLPEACCSGSCTAECPIGCTGAPFWGSLMFALWACWSHLQFCSLRPGTQPVPAMHAAAGASTGLPLMKQQLLLITKELIVGLAVQELQANCTL